MVSQMANLKLYKEFKEKQQKEINEFTSKYMIFAFSKEQLNAKLKELNLTEEEFYDQYYSYAGGAIRKADWELWVNLCIKHNSELKQTMAINEAFAIEAFEYEFYNHEVYIGDTLDALQALHLEWKDILANKKLYKAYCIAKRKYDNWCCEHI